MTPHVAQSQDHTDNHCRIIDTLATVRPKQLPILPPDVLIEILAVRPSARLEEDPPDNLPLLAASVCRYWRSVALSTPSVWTNVTGSITSRYHPNLFLERSTPYPFRLYLYFDNATSIPTCFMRALFRALFLHYRRLEELSIFYRTHDYTLNEFLPELHALDPLNIRALRIEAKCHPCHPSLPAPPTSASSAGITSYYSNIMFPWTPKLCFCKLPARWMSLFNPSHTFPSLTTLWITGCILPRFGFCRLAKQMPALQTLILEDVDQWSQGVDYTSSVNLPLLSVLVIQFHWHPSLSTHCDCLLGSIIAPNLEVLELGIRFEVNPDEGELLEFHEDTLREWRKPESKLRKIVFRGVLDPWHKGSIHIVRLLHKPIDVGYKGFKGRVLSAPPVKGDLIPDLRNIRSLSLDFTQLIGQDVFEALCRLTQMIELLLPFCPPTTVCLGEEMREHSGILELRRKLEGIVTFQFGILNDDEYWLNISNS